MVRGKLCLLVGFMMSAAVFAISACASGRVSENDARIVASMKDSYAYKTYLDKDDITVQSENGKVSLTGTVPEESHRVLAQEIATGLPGVRDVDNRLEVKETASGQSRDEAIAAAVKAELMKHKDISTVKADVASQDGIVTLTGSANSQAEKDMAAEYAKDVNGVRGVINQIAVAGSDSRTLGQEIDDASVTTRARIALLGNKATRNLTMQLETKGGVVTVRGTAKSEAEKNLVTRLVSGVDGVKGVNNEMTIQAPASFTP